MLDDNVWDAVSESVSAEDFYRSDHRIIFRCMAQLVERNQPIDIITISESLESTGELENVGGLAFISELASSTPTASNIKAYATIVRERATVRSLISVAHEIADSGFSPGGRTSAELIDEAEAKVFKISDDRPSTGGPESVRPLLT